MASRTFPFAPVPSIFLSLVKIYNRYSLMDMYEKDFVFSIVGLGLFGHGDLYGESSRPDREMDW
jgi:hypothetical protein